jgi:uncharacterized protein (TIGR03435 family)
MRLAVTWSILTLLAFGQNAEPPRFLAADVHVSAKTQNTAMRQSTRGDRYEVKNATMVDLIGVAYGFVPIKILGGPSWLEMDRFDVIAKQPPQTPTETQRLMLRSLLADRFKLVVREDVKPMPSYALTMGKKPQIKEGDGSGETGCKPQSSSGPPGEGTIRIGLANAGGAPVILTLANGMIEYKCRNMTMAAFVDGLRGLLGANLGVNPVLDQTGLSGIWNFDLRYSLGLIGPLAPQGERLTISEAIEKQLGLKLEERQLPTPVLVVESVNQKPGENPPGTAEALPATAAPAEFEVASVKATNPDSRNSRFQMQPGGRLTAEGVPLRFLITRAFNTNSSDQLTGVPSWADTTRFDVIAKAPSDGAAPQAVIDPETLAPMMLALLKDRFKLAYHTEERDLPVYTLVAVRPKMKKADPALRTWCKSPAQVPGAPPAPPGTQALICQNITMTQFADLLRGRTPDLQSPILDLTGIEGSYDFTLTFNPVASLQSAAIRPPDAGAPGNQTAASDPTAGSSIYDAVEKQLGIKLEKQKRPGQVVVIDHIEQAPTPD